MPPPQNNQHSRHEQPFKRYFASPEHESPHRRSFTPQSDSTPFYYHEDYADNRQHQQQQPPNNTHWQSNNQRNPNNHNTIKRSSSSSFTDRHNDHQPHFKQNKKRSRFEDATTAGTSHFPQTTPDDAFDQTIASAVRDAHDIPKFDPLVSEFTVHEWIEMLREAKTRHKWGDKQTIAVIEAKLLNKRVWYDKLSMTTKSNLNALLSSIEAALFPKTNFCNRLLSMINRTQLPHETFIQYFNFKMKQVRVCKLAESDAVACVIEGLQCEEATNRANQWYERGPRTIDGLRELILQFDLEIERNRNYTVAHCKACYSGFHIKYDCSNYAKRRYQ